MSKPRETRQDLRPVSSESSFSFRIETLENRRLLSATGAVVMQPAIDLTPLASNSTVNGYTPQQIDKAYGFDSITLDNGKGGTVKGDGSGQTIAIIDAYNDPNIASDLKSFDKQFSLSDPNFKVVSQTGSTTSLPKTDAGWAQEISLDVEWAHSVAPKANIMLVEAKSASLTDLLSAVDYARNAAGVSVVSMSWGTNEFMSEHNYDSHFTTPAGHQGVTFVASAGDDGSWDGASWPSVSSNVLSVGGTTLTLNSSGGIADETGWSDSGGGVAEFESEPSYQSQYGNIGGRGAPDVSINANPYTGYAVYDSLAFQGQSGWQVIGGTSAGAPQWSALVAIADQGRVSRGAGTLDGATGTLPALYSTYNASQYNSAFNDITVGRSSWFVSAGPHWDEVTGLGSPKGDFIANALAGFGLSVSTPTVTTPTSTTTTPSTKHADIVRHAESVAIVQAPVALPAAQPVQSIFSTVQLKPAIDLVSTGTTQTLTTTAASSGEIGEGAPGASGNGAGGSGHFQLINSRQADDDSTIMPSHVVSESNSNPLRHLLGAHANDQTFGPRPGRTFVPSSYDSASFAADRDDSDDALTWQQLAALIGTGVLVGSYAMEAQRRKRALMSNWPGIDSER